jgi:hypothetical protein
MPWTVEAREGPNVNQRNFDAIPPTGRAPTRGRCPASRTRARRPPAPCPRDVVDRPAHPAVVPQDAGALGHLGVIGEDHPRVADGPELLGGEERQDLAAAQQPRVYPVPAHPDRLGAVLTIGSWRRVTSRTARMSAICQKRVDGHDRRRARSHGGGQALGIPRVADVGEDGVARASASEVAEATRLNAGTSEMSLSGSSPTTERWRCPALALRFP